MVLIDKVYIPRGSLVDALPQVIHELHRGVLPLGKIAKMVGVDSRTLRSALRKGELETSGRWHELHLAELSSRDKRPWGRLTGPGKPLPRPRWQAAQARRRE